jgi:hypothetical protein
MGVHSARLGRNATLTTGTVTLYTVPSMKRTIVKCVVVTNAAAAANHVLLTAFNGATLLFSMTIWVGAAGADGDTTIALPWIVLNSTEVLKATAGAATVSVVVSGTELDV